MSYRLSSFCGCLHPIFAKNPSDVFLGAGRRLLCTLECNGFMRARTRGRRCPFERLEPFELGANSADHVRLAPIRVAIIGVEVQLDNPLTVVGNVERFRRHLLFVSFVASAVVR